MSRKKGTPNKRTQALKELREKELARGKSPLEFLLEVMRQPRRRAGFSPEDWWRLRLDAAKAAAPYIHPRLVTQKVEMGGVGGGPIEHAHSGGVLLVDSPMALEDWAARHGSGQAPVADDSDDEDGAGSPAQ